jgi:hypothetical protein
MSKRFFGTRIVPISQDLMMSLRSLSSTWMTFPVMRWYIVMKLTSESPWSSSKVTR